MRTVAVYPGRFHVFHQGHRAVYDHLVNQFGQENVYVATSAKQNDTDSPFTFSDKVAMMTKMGVPPSRIIQVTNTYKKDETAKELGLEPNTDHLVYALGAKDAERFSYTPESPLQLLSQTKKMKPVGKHAYVEVVPTATFNVLGKKIQNASEIRKLYRDGNDNDRLQIITDLYGTPDPELKSVFDQRLGVDDPKEGIIYGQEAVFAGDNPVNVMRERQEKAKRMLENIQQMKQKIQEIRQHQIDYIDEKRPRKK
jgi:nicotinamide mononucleotide adenylyltransferase